VHVLQPSLTALRPDDLLSLRLTWLNLELKDGALIREPDAKDAYIVVEFEPQHIAEQAYFEVANKDGYPVETPPGKPPNKDAATSASEKLPIPWKCAQSRVAGPSRLAFRVPDGVDSLPCTLDALLAACSEFPLSVVATAPPPPPPMRKGHKRMRPILVLGGVREPAPKETAIEAPWRLVLSPNQLGAWLHARGLVLGATSGRVELWHTRLGTRPGSGRTEMIHDGRYRYVPGADGEWNVDLTQDLPVDFNRTVRAVWSPDHMKRPPKPDNAPFRMSLDRNDRHQLVALMSDPGIKNWRSRFARARRLMLSSLGAWLDLDYAADPPADVSALTVEAWRHQATIGRDHYVRVVYAGYLFPFGHRASLVKVTERKFQRRPRATSDEAFLRQRMYIIVRQPEVEVDATRRQMPFRRVRITTVVTPNLDPPDQDPAKIQSFTRQGFWPIVGGAPFLFNVVAWDWENRRSEFSAPLIFVDRELDDQAANMTKIKAAYQAKSGQGDPLWRSRPFSGQQVAYAHPRQEPGSTSLQTESIEFSADALTGKAAPHFAPVVESAHARIPAVEQLVGSADATKITIDPDYVDDGWPTPPKGEVFARVPDGMPMKFRADRSGGVATPNLSIGGISRRFGPVGGSGANVGAFNDGTFTPSEFFAGAQAKILGGIDLFSIVQPLFGDTTVPKLTSKAEGPVDAPTALITSLLWKPSVQKFGPFQPWGGAQTSFELEASVRTDLVDPTQSKSIVKGKLTGFDMNLFGFVVLPFSELAFDTQPGQKTHVSAEIGAVTFGGPLAFVNELREYIGGDGFKDPPSLEVTDQGVTAGFSLELPTLAVGVMTIQNISFGAALNLPFTGDPVRFRFAFCSRERPFQLLIYCFGGGGFFAIAIGLDGVEQIEASLEFGAAISIDVGVASGGVHLMAGIYYSWKEAEKKAWLEGYLRMGGELDVLGLVSMSLEFIMSLAHDSSTNIVWGEAKLIVEIEVAFFSDSVEMSVRRELGDPPRVMFEQMLEPGDWNTYWSAFAA
jgi:hypothetical protein